jgi:hypothetical protein
MANLDQVAVPFEVDRVDVVFASSGGGVGRRDQRRDPVTCARERRRVFQITARRPCARLGERPFARVIAHEYAHLVAAVKQTPDDRAAQHPGGSYDQNHEPSARPARVPGPPAVDLRILLTRPQEPSPIAPAAGQLPRLCLLTDAERFPRAIRTDALAWRNTSRDDHRTKRRHSLTRLDDS